MFITFFTWLLVILSRNLAESAGKNSQSGDCGIEPTEHGFFGRITPSSKYFTFVVSSNEDSDFKVEAAKSMCGNSPLLEQGEVQHMYDLMSLERHNVSTSMPLWLGLYRDEEGIFKHGNGEPIQFQTFTGMNPDNLGNSERCVVLKPMDGYLGMEDVGCDSATAGVLCQFKKQSSCYLQSAEETANINGPGWTDLTVLAGGSGDQYFVSKEQKPWVKAHEVCMRYGMQLIKLDQEDRIQKLVVQMKKHLTELHLHPASQFWTSGLVTDGEKNDTHHFSWIIGEDLSEPAMIDVSGLWAPATADQLEPYDQSGSGFEHCLDISFENTVMSSAGSHQPYWRMSNCMLPKFFLCEKNIPAVPLEKIANITGMNPPKTGENENSTATTAAPNGNETETENEKTDGTSTMHCNTTTTKVDPVNYELDITTRNTREDIVKFMLFNVEHDLKSGMAPFQMKEEVKWKGTVIDILFQIAQKSVSSDYVDHGLLKIVKTINLMYQNAVADPEDVKRGSVWKQKYIPHLEKCLDATQSLPLSGTGFEITGVQATSDGAVSIIVLRELADSIDYLDTSLDILWYLFSLSVATCYPLPADKLEFASEIHIAFVVDFIERLKGKWLLNVGDKADGLDYSLALGDVDFVQSMRNLRYMVKAAYIVNNAESIELVRPLSLNARSQDDPFPNNARVDVNLFK